MTSSPFARPPVASGSARPLSAPCCAAECSKQTPPPADGSRRVKAHASIHVDSLNQARAWLVQQETERAERERRREHHGNPPDLDRVWLDTATVAAMAGLNVKWAQWMIREERMPATFHGGQYWVRREHAEVIVAARAFAERADNRTHNH